MNHLLKQGAMIPLLPMDVTPFL